MFGVWFHWSQLDEQGAGVKQAGFFGIGACLTRLSESVARMSAPKTFRPLLTLGAQGCAIASLPNQSNVILSGSGTRGPLHPGIQWRRVHYHSSLLTHVKGRSPRQASYQWDSLKQFVDPFVYVFSRNRLAV